MAIYGLPKVAGLQILLCLLAMVAGESNGCCPTTPDDPRLGKSEPVSMSCATIVDLLVLLPSHLLAATKDVVGRGGEG